MFHWNIAVWGKTARWIIFTLLFLGSRCGCLSCWVNIQFATICNFAWLELAHTAICGRLGWLFRQRWPIYDFKLSLLVQQLTGLGIVAAGSGWPTDRVFLALLLVKFENLLIFGGGFLACFQVFECPYFRLETVLRLRLALVLILGSRSVQSWRFHEAKWLFGCSTSWLIWGLHQRICLCPTCIWRNICIFVVFWDPDLNVRIEFFGLYQPWLLDFTLSRWIWTLLLLKLIFKFIGVFSRAFWFLVCF